MSPGPVSAPTVARTFVAGPVTTTWNGSNSFRAAARRALAAGRGAADGRIFSDARAVQTLAGARGARKRQQGGERDGCADVQGRLLRVKGSPVGDQAASSTGTSVPRGSATGARASTPDDRAGAYGSCAGSRSVRASAGIPCVPSVQPGTRPGEARCAR